MNIPSANSIKEAHDKITRYTHRTPLLSSSSINKIAGANIEFKCENFQKVGAFKMRGAANAVLSLSSDQLKKGVATHSSGNHAAALSLAAKIKNVPAYIVMPKTAPSIKKKAVGEYQGKITFCNPTQEAREKMLNEVVANTGATFIHPYDNYKIIEGQATCVKEVFEDSANIDYIISPIGGGGLLSGTCLSANYFSPATKVVGAEPAGADDAFRSLRDNRIYPSINPETIADGLLTSFSEKTFDIVRRCADRIITADDSEIIAAMRLIWDRMKIIIEPSAAITLAVVLQNPGMFSGKKICCILTGGNVDLQKLPW